MDSNARNHVLWHLSSHVYIKLEVVSSLVYFSFVLVTLCTHVIVMDGIQHYMNNLLEVMLGHHMLKFDFHIDKYYIEKLNDENYNNIHFEPLIK